MANLVPDVAYSWVNQRALFAEAVERKDWSRALLYTDSQYVLPLFLCMWPAIPVEERSSLLAEAMSSCDAPSQCRSHLLSAMQWCIRRNERAFDSEAAQQSFDQLPAEVAVYRGTVFDEYTSGQLGVCWSLASSVAQFFATEYIRYGGNRRSAVILSAMVSKQALCGMATDREEQEVWLVPSMCWSDLNGPAINRAAVT